MSQLLVGLLWLLHWLPFGALARVGSGLGVLLYVFAGARRHVASTNIRLCFPELDEAERTRLVKAHFRLLGRSFIDRGVLWWGSRERLERFIRVEGLEHVEALRAEGRPVILLAPHFVGLDAGGVAITMRFDIVSIYARQKDPVFDRWIHHGRSRFGDQLLLARDEGVRPTVKALKAGRPFYYLPDMNFRTRDAIFAPFFGVQAWTITGLPRLAKVSGAAVVNCATRMLPQGGYLLELGKAWTDYPSGDIEADTARMNREIETIVRTMPDQYYWVHRRFKTRPPGEPRRY
ncbi:lysophospholipid acyltransferase family protein [Azoarcus taiwanensis]|uniref:Lipid A biosynthesis acyltransferase n=1 Tax=Azoarcus taiwanensis TaxID=666964 RepID=A0A972J7I9_9RHOO|nr:lysophospholipid acyltransferase family protein [Azoarcus taiwanensis]NMG01959.1 lipid A biosynthesis acyltransferase [Azoarcus taiwanensis]